MAVGMLFVPVHADRAIAAGQCDLAAIARGKLHDPHWAWRAAAALGGEVSHPPQYFRGYLSSCCASSARLARRIDRRTRPGNVKTRQAHR